MLKLFHTKDYMIYIISLCFLCALAESMLPHPIPFLRYGLANIPILLVINKFKIKELSLLFTYKTLITSLTSGTLLSPLFILSLSSSIASFIVVISLRKVKSISLYSISVISAVLSSIFQVLLASLILSTSVLNLLSFMILFSILSGIFTATIAYKINLPEEIKEIEEIKKEKNYFVFIYLPLAILIFFIKDIVLLLIIFILSLALNLAVKRKIYIFNYLITFSAILFFNLLDLKGEVLYGFITKEALTTGLYKGLILISLVSLSQSFTPLCNNFYFTSILAIKFKKAKGNIIKRINIALNDNSDININRNIKINYKALYIIFFFMFLFITIYFIKTII